MARAGPCAAGRFPVLVLDEPTEHLDEATAVDLGRDVLAATRDRTVLMITHRTDLLSDVDEVVRLDSLVQNLIR